ncbi:unnamed protein product [Urochloa humidicola]
MDREACVMLMAFLTDARTNTTPSTAVSGFGLLRYWHDTMNVARIVAKVNLHDDAKILHGVILSAGVPPKSRSWMCLVFALKKKSVTMLANQEPIPPNGPLFPLPPFANRWKGVNPAANGSASVGQQKSPEGRAPMACDDAVNEMGSADDGTTADGSAPPTPLVVKVTPLVPDTEPADALMAVPLQIIPADTVLIPNPQVMNFSNLSISIPHPLRLNFSTFLTTMDFDLDTIIPPYLADHDSRFFLASIAVDQPEESVRVFGLVKPLVPYSDDEDDEDKDVREI